MLKIGLIDLDKSDKFPNLALMKISGYHKSKGDIVEFYEPLFNNGYDIVYVSKVFSYSLEYQYPINAKKIIYGGVGFDLHNKLHDEIENHYPDYTLYSFVDKNTAYGFLTRGCPRQCSFCNVSASQGKESRKVAELTQFWKGQKNIVLLDPNITACKDWRELFQQLIDSKAKIEFTQGIDIRTMTEEIAEYLSKIKIKNIHFAWDNPKDNLVYEQLKRYRKNFKQNHRDLIVYILTNYNSTFKEDFERVVKVTELGYTPYIMIYDKDKLPKKHKLKRMQRFTNNKFIFNANIGEDFSINMANYIDETITF